MLGEATSYKRTSIDMRNSSDIAVLQDDAAIMVIPVKTM